MPAPAANEASRRVSRRQSRHSPVRMSAMPTIMREKSSRHAATTSGSAFDNRVSGPAKEIPSRLRVSTPGGDCSTPGNLRLLDSPVRNSGEQLTIGYAFRAKNLPRIAAASRRIRSANASGVALQRTPKIGRVLEGIGENTHAVADVALDVVQVVRLAAPASTMERHHL